MPTYTYNNNHLYVNQANKKIRITQLRKQNWHRIVSIKGGIYKIIESIIIRARQISLSAMIDS